MAVAMQNRVGEVHKTNEGYEIKIIDYIQSSKVLIEFQDEFHSQKWTQYDYCLKGSVKNPFHRTVYGVGFLGVGDYTTTIDKKPTKCYDTWKGMLRRCYDLKYQQKDPLIKTVPFVKSGTTFKTLPSGLRKTIMKLKMKEWS